MYGAVGDGRPKLLPVYVRVPNMSVLLASDPDRREWSLPRLSEGLP